MSFCTRLNSSRQGPHQVAQKFRSTTLPRRLPRVKVVPSNISTRKSGACVPALTRVVASMSSGASFVFLVCSVFGAFVAGAAGCGSVGQQPHQGDDDREQDDHQDKTFVIGFFTFGHSDIIGFQSLTSVPIFSPASTFSRLPGVSMSKTMTRRPFSRQSVKAVISITFRLRR